jgi:hypothetical protein
MLQDQKGLNRVKGVAGLNNVKVNAWCDVSLLSHKEIFPISLNVESNRVKTVTQTAFE